MAWFDDPAILTTLQSLLKEVLHPQIIDELNRECKIYGTVRRRTEPLVGEQWQVAVDIGQTEAIGYVAENRSLPTAHHQSYERNRLFPKALFGRLLVTIHAMEQTASDLGSLAEALESETRGLVRDFKYEMARVMWGNGTGILANCIPATNVGLPPVAPTAVTVQDSWGLVTGDPRPTRLFRPDMWVATINAAGNATTGVAQIQSVDSATQITIDNGVGNFGDGANALAIVRCNTDAAHNIADTGFGTLTVTAANQRESYGLQNVANSSPYMGTDGTLNTWWASYMRDMAGAVVTEDDIMEALDEVEILSDAAPTTLFTSHIIQRKIATALKADRRFVNTMTYSGGWRGVEVAGYPLVRDRHCPVDMVFGIDLNDIAVYQTRDPFWLDEDGSILHRRENVPAYQAVMGWFWNLRSFDRKRHFRLYNCDCT